jgi:hypothetical protein
MREQCSDRWKRELRSGLRAYVSLWARGDDTWRFEIVFKLRADAPTHWEIGEIADELMEVLNRREKPGSWFPWEPDQFAEQLAREERRDDPT